MDLNDDIVFTDGQTWHLGDLLVLKAHSRRSNVIDGHLRAVLTDEPLILLGFSGVGICRQAQFMSARYGLCWRNVWRDFRDNVSLVQRLDMNPGAFHA